MKDTINQIRQLIGLKDKVDIIGYNLTSLDGKVQTLECKISYKFPVEYKSYVNDEFRNKISISMKKSWNKKRKSLLKYKNNTGAYSLALISIREFTTSKQDRTTMKYFLRLWKRKGLLLESEINRLEEFQGEYYSELSEENKQQFLNTFNVIKERLYPSNANGHGEFLSKAEQEIPV